MIGFSSSKTEAKIWDESTERRISGSLLSIFEQAKPINKFRSEFLELR